MLNSRINPNMSALRLNLYDRCGQVVLSVTTPSVYAQKSYVIESDHYVFISFPKHFLKQSTPSSFAHPDQRSTEEGGVSYFLLKLYTF